MFDRQLEQILDAIIRSIKAANDSDEEFLRTRALLSHERRIIATLAKEYIKTKNIGEFFTQSLLESMLEQKPKAVGLSNCNVFFVNEWLPQSPIDILGNNKIELKLVHEDLPTCPSLDFGDISPQRLSTIFAKNNIKCDDNRIYRLLNIAFRNGKYIFEFTIDSYYNYINTCEVLSYNFANQIFAKKKSKVGKFEPLQKIINKLEVNFTNRIENFKNRVAAVGISTLLVLLDDNGSIFYMHRRNNNCLAEGENTTHVVPAGTFQPRNDACIERDCDFYTNIMKEFGEELLGKKEFEKNIRSDAKVLDHPAIKPVDELIKNGFGKVYYIGTVIDCLSLKPEVLTVLVLKRKEIEKALGKKVEENLFIDSYEGEHEIKTFSPDGIKIALQDHKLLGIAEACLRLVLCEFDFFRNCI